MTELIAEHGGRSVAPAGSCPWEMSKGSQPDITGVSILAFPTMDAARYDVAAVFGRMDQASKRLEVGVHADFARLFENALAVILQNLAVPRLTREGWPKAATSIL